MQGWGRPGVHQLCNGLGDPPSATKSPSVGGVAAGGKIGDITLTAPRAEYHNITRDVRMDGKVIAKSSSGMEFTTEDAEYIAARGVIVSSGRVTFTDGKLTMEGVGMEFKPETKNIRILNGVTANIEPGAGK